MMPGSEGRLQKFHFYLYTKCEMLTSWQITRSPETEEPGSLLHAPGHVVPQLLDVVFVDLFRAFSSHTCVYQAVGFDLK